MKKDLFLNALACQNRGRKPVWIMRQAGRFLPEYRALREKHSLTEMFFTPELMVEATLLPMKVIQPDAAILFSDILMVAKALGLELTFLDKVGPVVRPLVKTKEDVLALTERNIYECLGFVAKAIKELKNILPTPLIGFCGAPFTVASYLIEENHAEGLHHTKKWLYQNPESFQLLLEKITRVSISYIEMQMEAGVEAVQIFDSFAHVLSKPLLKVFSFPYLQKIINAVKARGIPVIVFMRGSCLRAEELAALSPSGISFDWQEPLTHLRKKVPSQIAMQGNFDPHLLFASHEVIRKTVKETLQEMNHDPGYIVNLGHGILPETEVEKVQTFIGAVKDAG